MKKTSRIICSILAVLLLFAGCSSVGGIKKIEKYNWDFDIVQNSAHMVIASSEKSSFNSDEKLNLTLKAKNNSITIHDGTNSKDYVLNYSEVEATEELIKYKVTTGSNEGVATVKLIKNGNLTTPTLYITIGGYSLRFIAGK